MQRDRRERDDRAERREHDERQVERALAFAEFGEGGLEREREQEAGEDLRAGLHDAQLLQHLVPVAVGALGRRLVATVDPVVVGMRVARGGHVLILARPRARSASNAAARCDPRSDPC